MAIQLLLFYRNLRNKQQQIYRNYISPSNLLLLGLFIVNIQRVFDYGLGISTPRDYMIFGQSYIPYIARVFYYSLAGITTLLLGLSTFRETKMPIKNLKESNISIAEINRFKLVALIVLCSSFVAYIATIDISTFINGTVYHLQEASDKTRSISTLFETILNYSVIIYISTIIYYQKRNRRNFQYFLGLFSPVFWIIVIMYLLLKGLGGDRGPIIYFSLALLYAYVKITGKRFKMSFIITMIIASAFFMNLLNIYRGSAYEGLSNEVRIVNAWNSMGGEEDYKSIIPFTAELANSINCDLIVVRGIENQTINYGYGIYNLSNIIAFFPGSTTFYKLLGIDLPRLGDVINEEYFGKSYLISLGSTSTTGFLIDFGIVGILLGFFIMGLFFHKIDLYFSSSEHRSLKTIILFLYFAHIAIYIPRFNFTGALGNAMYCLCIYYFIRIISWSKIK